MQTSYMWSAEEEQAWVTRAQSEPAEFATLFDHYFPRIYRYMLYRIPDAPTADDLTAQTFETAMTRLIQYDAARGSFAAWLFTIARNTANKHLRGQRVRRWVSLDALWYRASPDAGLDEIAVTSDKLARVLGQVAKLPDRDRDVLALKFGAGLTNRRIGELLRLTESHIGVILHRTLHHLRDELRGEGYDKQDS
jgi:RNA polymerase sigma-70 factor, ECF subfamily